MAGSEIGTSHPAIVEIASEFAIPGTLPRGEGNGTFVFRQNITHDRLFLESGTLDEAQRESIEKLLNVEGTKIHPGHAES
jgi:hypothetical protein